MLLLRHSLVVLFAIYPLASSPIARGAEIVLDEFVDQAFISSPSMLGEVVTTENVGDLRASRAMRIASVSPNIADGALDVSTGKHATLTLDLNGVRIVDAAQDSMIGYHLDYSFTPTDVVTDRGNDALFIDFDLYSGNDLPLLVRAIAGDAIHPTISYEARSTELIFSRSPFSLALPFSSFVRRGRGVGSADFTMLRHLDLEFFGSGDLANSRWHAEVSRIRFGRMLVPEPPGLVVITVMIVTLSMCSVGSLPTRIP